MNHGKCKTVQVGIINALGIHWKPFDSSFFKRTCQIGELELKNGQITVDVTEPKDPREIHLKK